MKKTTGLLAVLVTMILIFSGCQNTAKTEQSGYKIFCRNEDATALREVKYEPEAEGGENRSSYDCCSGTV